MALYKSFNDLIGNTPLVELSRINRELDSRIYAKLELYNPSGSVKDRAGKYMVADAEAKGILKPGYTIVDAAAGNTGLGIALSALGKGYQVVFVVPTKFSIEKQQLLKALGAKIINTSREEGMLGATRKAEELLQTIPNSISLKQFNNLSNPQAHYETTGPEIYEDLKGDIDYIVLGAGSGGTLTGTVKCLKERIPNITAVLADPVGSTIGGGEHADYKIEGIGNDFIADTLDISLVDKVIKIDDKEAFEGARELARKEGIIAGSSSGAAYAAAKKLVKEVQNANIVILLPDRGDRYFSTGLWEIE
ncbi:MAG TPA: cysteine synthase family protein [Saccharofermentans sp.]|nr:cysteine synthase family protein [Saccharofermentans sp.]HPE27854.1 cysteine synthase family protein [Saccharofermentans sp.]HPQ31481.1 cysteine synthase family protein [Saccharofermentans sp.]